MLDKILTVVGLILIVYVIGKILNELGWLFWRKII